MDQSCSKSVSVSRPMPFKATLLWNEAVNLFQSGMPVKRHFYRMKYYDYCFTGKEAVDWLSKALLNNPHFGKNVTTHGVHKLLHHFLKSGVLQSVKGSLEFKGSGLYVFGKRTIELTEKRDDYQSLHSQKKPKVVDQNIPHEKICLTNKEANLPNYDKSTRPTCLSNLPLSHQNPEQPIIWKEFILDRIQHLLPSLSVELLVAPETIQADSVMYNVCPAFENMRKNTELPFLVFSAITTVIDRHKRESEYTTYCGFERDVYSTVKDYLRQRNSPMIPYFLYELIMYTFNHLHYIDLERKNRLLESDSVDNLMLSMSNEGIENHRVQLNDLTKTLLPPNSCYETAFTSDEPVTRIVPQSSVDTVCLKLTNIPESNVKCGSNSSDNRNKIPTFTSIKTKVNCNITINKKRTSHLRRTHSVAHLDSNFKRGTLPLCFSAGTTKDHSGDLCKQSYTNYGLSQSMDELLPIDANDTGGLDFEEAMQSVNCLMKATRGVATESLVSNHKLLLTSTSFPFIKTELVCIDSSLWYENIQDTARLVFQYILMLMSPANRTSLRMLLQFIGQLSLPLSSSISKTEMVYDLTTYILSARKGSKNVYSQPLVLSVVYFLVDNCNYIFRDIRDTYISSTTITEQQSLNENKLGQVQKVFCEQLTKNQFEDQGVASSCKALTHLLDQIINDQKMKPKEKKKKLKKFKEAHPQIYNQRMSSFSTNWPNLAVHFR